MLENNTIELKAEILRKIEMVEIEGTRFVRFKDVNTTQIGEDVYKTEKQGVTLRENVERVRNLDNIDLGFNIEGIETTLIVATATKEDYVDVMTGKKHITDVLHYAGDKEVEDGIMILWHSYNHTIYDMQLNIIPLPILIDSSYLINEGTHDLAKLLDCLKKDERVLGREDLMITDIPCYNQGDRETKTIVFKCLLGVEDYKEAMKTDSLGRVHNMLDNILNTKETRIKR